MRRFSLFYEYFENYLSIKKKSEEENDTSNIFLWIKSLFVVNLTDYEIYKHSITLSIFLCYYLRIKKKEDRREFVEIMDDIFRNNFELNFLDIPIREEEYIINNIQLPSGIAKNEALLHNIFVLFVCITSKIPLFIVGKPGCSKSLSVQLLFKSMKGEDSDSSLFRTLPKLYINSYQGSLSSTSQGILRIFQKARRILQKMNNKEIDKVISMVFIYIMTDFTTIDWWAEYSLKKGTFSCLIILFWYNFCYSIYWVRYELDSLKATKNLRKAAECFFFTIRNWFSCFFCCV